MQAAEMWAAFAAEAGLDDTPWEAWAFGEAADELAALVLRGVKTATSSAYALYALAGEPLPPCGGVQRYPRQPWRCELRCADHPGVCDALPLRYPGPCPQGGRG